MSNSSTPWNVIEKMRQIGSSLGGEESGHMVLLDYARTGDALIAGLIVCLGVVEDGRKSSEIFPVFEKCPCKITSVRFETKEDMSNAFEKPEIKTVIKDAQNQIEGKGSVIVRKSGTEPVIKIRVESEDEELIHQLSERIVQTIEEFKS